MKSLQEPDSRSFRLRILPIPPPVSDPNAFPHLVRCFSIQALDLDLDGARLGVRGRVKGLERILELEAVRDELGHVDDAVLDQADGARPGVGLAVLELQVDLADAGAHELHVDLVAAHADDEHLAAELDCPDGRVNAALDAGALDRHGGLNAAEGADDRLGRVLGRRPLHLVRDHRRTHLLGEG